MDPDLPKTGPRRPKQAPDASKPPQAKMVPRQAQDGPRQTQGAPRKAQDHLRHLLAPCCLLPGFLARPWLLSGSSMALPGCSLLLLALSWLLHGLSYLVPGPSLASGCSLALHGSFSLAPPWLRHIPNEVFLSHRQTLWERMLICCRRSRLTRSPSGGL